MFYVRVNVTMEIDMTMTVQISIGHHVRRSPMDLQTTNIYFYTYQIPINEIIDLYLSNFVLVEIVNFHENPFYKGAINKI